MNRDRFVSASLELNLAEQRVAGSLELARSRGDAVAVRSLDQAGIHLRALRAILTADRMEALQAEPAPCEWRDLWGRRGRGGAGAMPPDLLADARLAEADARAREREARRAGWAPLADRYRDEADGLGWLVVKLEREEAAAVKTWADARLEAPRAS